jgi:glutaredoxin 3
MTAIDEPPVTLYTRRWCGYCFAVRRLLDQLGIQYEETPLDRQPELRNRVSKMAGGWPTVPLIFIGERFVGGYAEIAALHRRGELVPMVEASDPNIGPPPTTRTV